MQSDPAAEQEERAQEDTRLGVSGEVAEAEAAIETGARVDESESGSSRSRAKCPMSRTPALRCRGSSPSRSDPRPRRPLHHAPTSAGRDGDAATAPAEPRESRRERREREKEERRKTRAKELQKGQAEKAEKRRGPVLGFLLSCWAELKRVQWPDRDTLVQASAVTFIFVAVMAAYLGGLDAAFNWLIQRII